jgi:hypothetical protein
MKIQYGLIVGAGLALLFAPLGYAQAPAWHAGTFEMPAPAHCGGVKYCGTAAFKAMSDRGLNPRRDGDFHVDGHSNDATIVVMCVPLGGDKVWAGIFAASANSSSAESLRNTVRTSMVGQRCL